MDNIYTDAAGAPQDDVRVLLARGAYDSRKPSDKLPEGRDYDTISWAEICGLLERPTSYKKTEAPFIIPSSYAGPFGRAHASQKQMGSYWLSTVDIDRGDHALSEVEAAVEAVMGQVATAVYATASSRPGSMKWRVLVLHGEALEPGLWNALQLAIFEALADRGIECDKTLARWGQPVFLPNVPDEHVADDGTVTVLRGEDRAPLFYTFTLFEDAPFVWDDDLDVCQRALEILEEAQRREAEMAARVAVVGDQPDDGNVDPAVAWFNRQNDLIEMLVECGYETVNGVDWMSPFASSFSTRVFDGARWVSLSDSDGLERIGRAVGTVGDQEKVGAHRYGRAYDLWAKFVHRNDREAALSAVRQAHAEALSRAVSDRMPRLQELAAAAQQSIVREAIEAGADAADVAEAVEEAEAEASDAPQLQRDPRGRPVLNENNIREILTTGAWRGVFRFDEFRGRIVVASRPPGQRGRFAVRDFDEENDLALALLYVQRHFFIRASRSMVMNGLMIAAQQDRYNSLTEFVGGVVGGASAEAGSAALDDWLVRFCGCPDNAYVRAVGRKTLLGMVARAMEPGVKFDTCLVLVGPQGARKSTLAATLAMKGDFFLPGLHDMGGKDAMVALRGHWVVELAELAALRKSEIEQVKSYLSQRVDTYRPPYGRSVVSVPRQCVFVATTNDAFFLTDMTGNRRFWPVTVGRVIDTVGLRDALPDMLAAAWEAVGAGEQIYLDGDIAAQALSEAEAYAAGDETLGMVTSYLTGRNEVSLTEVWRFALKNEASAASAFNKIEQRRVRELLVAAGWRRASADEGAMFKAGPRRDHKRWVSPVSVDEPVKYGPEGEANKAGLHVVK